MSRSLTLITGASSGIGKCFAERLAKAGHDVLLVARRLANLEALASELQQAHGVAAHCCAQDLTALDAPERILAFVEQHELTVTGVINNAGFGMGGAFLKNDVKALDEMLIVNVLALTKLTRLFLPKLVERREGFIMNVASTAAFQPMAGFAAYAATKAYVLSLSEALAEEVKAHGVRVVALCPGPTKTEFFEVAQVSSASGLPMMSAEAVVEAGIEALRLGKVVQIPGAINAMMAKASPLTPRALRNLVLSRMMKH